MNLKNTIALIAALGLSIPAIATFSPADAHAQGKVLDSSSKSGKRTHKRAGAKRTETKKKKKSRPTTTRSTANRTTSRTTTTRSAPQGYRATETRVYRSSGTSTRAQSYRSRTTTRHRTTSYRNSRPVYAERHQYRRQYSNDYGEPATRSTANTGSNIDVYVTGGIGVSGFSSNTISDDALPGIGWNVALGGKGEYLGMELGLDGGGYTFDPEGTNETELGLFGLYFDLKLQPTIAQIFEPYVFAGVGGYVLSDAILVENTGGGAYRLGLGANLRFDSLAIGGKYLYQGFGFTDDSGLYGGDFGGASETVSLGLTIYF
ncbi:porin family protein [Microvenator marinus]|uniref:Porin family protein n=1 Tax=Microvenator marinus TaxID=2600177 RepID=A0A5B8XSK7_9DELT|nr:porin family protein [Microvenator marinus]QED28187.1 porin family protein [Microvenator marinus]